MAGVVIAVFIFNMSEFIPIGLLTGISEDFGISESSAGLIISVYAWAVAILSLPMMLLLKKMEFRRMLLLSIALFTVFQFASGVATGYGMLVVSRLGVAAAHAIFWSIAPNLAIRVVSERYRRVALSMVAVGTSIAMIVGLPVGRVIGLALGWRMAFLVIAAVAVATLVLILVVFPHLENPGTFTLKRLPEIFRNRTLVCIYVVLAIYITGCYTGYSYIEPFLQQVGGLDDLVITVALVVFGLAGFIGSSLFARMYEGHRCTFLLYGFIGTSVSLLLMRSLGPYLLGALVVCTIWGALHTCFNTAYQNETLRAASEDAGPIAMSLFSGIYNVGIAMGPIVGGLVIDNLGMDLIGYAGSIFTLTALVIAALVLVPRLRAGEDRSV
ncbi:MAG: MFS transporter [archaeon]|nr:MFS transporter [archaeon]